MHRPELVVLERADLGPGPAHAGRVRAPGARGRSRGPHGVLVVA
jgi:hypothetical protein